MLLYILKFSVILGILLLFYNLFLERESMHMFKRFFLLGALVFALTVPQLVFTEYVAVAQHTATEIQHMTNTTSVNETINVAPALKNDLLDIAPLLWGVYLLGVIFFGLKFIKNLFQIYKRIKNNAKEKDLPFIRVLLRENFPPHTFFNYIFLNKAKFESQEIPKAVLLHEETHARQRHSFDVLFVEVIQVLFWFNPLIYFVRKSIKLNHEFLADHAVLQKGVAKSTYQNTLLSFMTPRHQTPLANAINYSSIKKRFTVMKKRTSKKAIILRSILSLPLVVLLIYGFSETRTIEIQESEAQTSNEGSISSQIDSIKKEKYYEKVVFKFLDENGKVIRQAKYSELTLQEKSQLLPPTDLSLKSNMPSQKDLDDWSDNNKYGVWLDNQRIDNQKLIDYKPHDFGTFFVSKLMKNAKNYGNHFYQVNLYSQDAYKKQSNNKLLPLDKGVEIYILSNSTIQTRSISSSQNQRENRKFIKDWYITINGKKYYYLRDSNLVWRYYDETKKEVNLDIEAEYEKKYIKYIGLKNNGTHYINKSKNEQRELDNYFSDLGGMFFRAPKSIRTKIKRPISPYAPYLRIIKNGEIEYKKQSELSEEDKSFIPPPPRSNNSSKSQFQEGATSKQLEEYNALAKKYNRQLSTKKSIQIFKSDVERLEYLHGIMTHEQKESAEPFPDFPEPPPAPKAPIVKAGEESNIPPPPPPAPMVRKGEKSAIPPPPKAAKVPKAKKGKKNDLPPSPSASNLSEVEVANRVIDEIIAHQDPYDDLGGPVYPNVSKGKNSNIPPPPPPKSPVEHVQEMVKQGALFYYGKQKITSDEAIDLLKTNGNLSMDISKKNNKPPVVKISRFLD